MSATRKDIARAISALRDMPRRYHIMTDWTDKVFAKANTLECAKYEWIQWRRKFPDDESLGIVDTNTGRFITFVVEYDV